MTDCRRASFGDYEVIWIRAAGLFSMAWLRAVDIITMFLPQLWLLLSLRRWDNETPVFVFHVLVVLVFALGWGSKSGRGL